MHLRNGKSTFFERNYVHLRSKICHVGPLPVSSEPNRQAGCSWSYLISSLMPRLARNDFIDVQEVSRMPIRRRTPSRMSRIASGGARNERISDSASFRMSDTADRASASSGSISAISWSIPFFLKEYSFFFRHMGINCFMLSVVRGVSAQYT